MKSLTTKKLLLATALASTLMLTACQHPGQNNYGEFDVGQNIETQFGTIIKMRPVDITGQNTGTGASVGALAGMTAGSTVGQGDGQIVGMLAGALIGGIAGAVVEQEMKDRKGIEYVIVLHNKKTITIVQNLKKDDEPLHKGQRVIVQTSGGYNRVLPAEDLPTQVKRPKAIEVN